MTTGGLRGRWAQGLQPRYFTWVIKDRLGAGERPGGFARNHRKVRRQEELIWLNCYHAHVLAKIGPQLKGEDLAWLQAACAPIEV